MNLLLDKTTAVDVYLAKKALTFKETYHICPPLQVQCILEIYNHKSILTDLQIILLIGEAR